MLKFYLFTLTLIFCSSHESFAQSSLNKGPRSIVTNSVVIQNAPSWLTQGRVQQVIDRVERKLEWSIRRTQATFYADSKQMLANFSGRAAPEIMAFTKGSDLSIHIGPRVTKSNFDLIFGHELAHVVIFQKYKSAVPPWLNEGLCNSVAGYKTINYTWLAAQSPRVDITQLYHPYDPERASRADVHYMASLAAVKMLEKKCPSFRELLNLSLKSNINDYIKTYCRIPDLNQAFWSWVDENAKKEKSSMKGNT